MPIVPIEAVQPAVQATQIVQIQEIQEPTPAVDPAALAKFQEAMAAQDVQPTAEAVEATAPVKEPFVGSLDAAFVNAEEQNRQMMQRVESLIIQAGNNGGMSPADVMALQYQISNMTFQQEAVSKVVDKVSTSIQTLIKNQ